MNYLELNYVSLAAMVVALMFSLMLPKVQQSIYFYRDADSTGQDLNFHQRIQRAYPVLWKDFVHAFTNPYVLRWSLWWVIAQALHLQVLNYIQPMWENIASYEKNSIYNGAVEAIHTVVSKLHHSHNSHEKNFRF